MASPFPGMDPFIEAQSWSDFHARFIVSISDVLLPALRPRYVARVEERVYLEQDAYDHIRPDVTIIDRGLLPQHARGAELALADPLTVTLPVHAEAIEHYLTIRDRETLEVVTVIEVLSPGNKRSAGAGRWEYLRKREEVLRSASNLVELDLLRGGERLPTLEPLPAADYFAFVSRVADRPWAHAYHATLVEPLPVIPVPLTGKDPDVPFDLRAALTATYDRGGYDYSLDYGRPVEPALAAGDAAWVREIVIARSA